MKKIRLFMFFMCSTTRKAQYTKEEFGSALADHGWPVKRVYWNGQPVNVVEYNGVAYYANREVTPVHSSDNIDNESTSSWPYTAVQSGVEFSAGVTHSIDDNVSFGGAQWLAPIYLINKMATIIQLMNYMVDLKNLLVEESIWGNMI